MDAADIPLVLFILYCLRKGRIEAGGQGVHPDEQRRREMERLREERFRDSGHD